MIVIRDKTDFLAVRLSRYRKADFFRKRAYFILRIFPDRHPRTGKLLLRQAVEGIGLIFSGCFGSRNGKPAVVPFYYSGIMPGCNTVRSNFHCPAKQRFPLYIAVAGDAGIRRPALYIFLHKIIHYAAFEIVCEIHYIERNVQFGAYPPRIFHRAQRTALLPRRFPLCVFLPKAHGNAGHFIPLFF